MLFYDSMSAYCIKLQFSPCRFVVHSTHLMESRVHFHLFGCVVLGWRRIEGIDCSKNFGNSIFISLLPVGIFVSLVPGSYMYAFAAYFPFHRFLFGFYFSPIHLASFFFIFEFNSLSPFSRSSQLHLERLVLFAVIFLRANFFSVYTPHSSILYNAIFEHVKIV